jgi:shikimate kinase/3-dehydroquinate synthase
VSAREVVRVEAGAQRADRAGHAPYEVRIGSGVLDELGEACRAWTRTFVLTDENVARWHGSRLQALRAAGAAPAVRAIAPGEGSKTLTELERTLDALVEAGCDRGSGLVAFGGGVVGDLGGLAAALYHRGIPCLQAPTTLLAMVDSSVGGKTAVDLKGGRNLAGAFHQPCLVLADTGLLATLSDVEYRAGLGEVLKTALIDGPLLGRLEEIAGPLARRDTSATAEVVAACVRRKAAIVALDPHEAGPRRQLNLGHTFAHAIEHAAGAGRVPHGLAVAVGVGLALAAAERAGVLREAGLPARVRALARSLGLPARLAELGGAAALGAIAAAMARDKKSSRGAPRFVLPRAAGDVAWDVELAPAELAGLLEREAG